MNRPYTKAGSWICTAVGAAALCTGTLQGAMVAEWQFNDVADWNANSATAPAGGGVVALDYAAPGASTESIYLGQPVDSDNVMYFGGSTGISSNWASFLQTGYFRQPTGNNSASTSGLRTNSDGTAHYYETYMGFGGLGSGTYDSGPDLGKTKGGTVYMVIRPTDGWNNNAGSYGLFGSGKEHIVLSKESSNALQLKVAGVSTNIAAPTGGWDTESFYYVAASWSNDAAPVLFVREMGDDLLSSPEGVLSVAGSTASHTAPNSQPFFIGTRSTATGDTRSRGTGDWAYVRIDNVYTSSAEDMNVIFEGLAIPEPATASMLGFMSTAMLLRRKRNA